MDFSDDIVRSSLEGVLTVRATTDIRVDFAESLLSEGKDRQAAILCLELGPTESREVLKGLDEEDRVKVLEAISHVGDISQEEIANIFRDLKSHSTI
jgi:hypothetical protein